MGAAVAAAVAGWPAEGIAGFNGMQRAACVEPKRRAAIGVAGSRAAHRGAIDGVESTVEAAPVCAGRRQQVAEGVSRVAREAERPSELVAPRPAHRWPRGAAAPRILARHTSAPQRLARGDRQLLGPAESRGNGAGARLGPHRVRGHRCGRLKRLQGGRFPKETSRAMRRRRWRALGARRCHERATLTEPSASGTVVRSSWSARLPPPRGLSASTSRKRGWRACTAPAASTNTRINPPVR